MTLFDVLCDRCGYIIAREDPLVYQYVLLDNGRRVVLPHSGEAPAAERVITKAIGKIGKKSFGFVESYVCLSCLKESRLDEEKDKIVCPSCGSRKVKLTIEMHDEKCPKCRKGKISAEPVALP